MADAQLKAVISADDKASKVIAGVSGSLDTVQSKVQAMQPAFKAMAAVGTVAFGTIAALSLKAVKDYSDVETANKMLEHAVIDVSHATREQLKATSDLADVLERKGVLDADNIKTGLAQLSTFGLSNKAVQALGGSLADLAVNQFGVAASGDQLSDSANMIAKALRGQFGILEKSGIRFTAAQKKMIEFGTEMQKVQAINEGFQQNLKFTNEVALSTFAGKLAHIKVQVNGLSESIGKALFPAFEKLLQKISPLLEKIIAWTEAHPKLLIQILAVTAGLSGLLAILGFIGLAAVAFTAAGTAMIPVLAAIGIAATGAGTALLITVGIIAGVVLGLAALGVAVYMVIKHWDEIKAKTIEIWNAIPGFLNGVWNSITTTITNVWEGIKNYFITTWNGLSESAKGWILLIGTILTGGLLALALKIYANWDEIKAKTIEAWESIKTFLAAHWQAILIVVLGPLGLLIGQIITHWTEVKEATISAWNSIRDFFAEVWGGIKSIFTDAIDSIMKKMQPLLSAVDKVQSAGSSIGKSVGGAFSKVGTQLNKAIGVHDAIIAPNGNIITTHPDDYLIATKNPGSLGGGSITINVYGDVSGQDLIEKVKRGIMQELKFNAQV